MTRLSENVRVVTNGDGGIALDLRQGKILRFNQTGAFILELLAHGFTEEQIASDLARCRDACPWSVSEDVKEFLSTLSSMGWLREDAPPLTRE